MSIKGHKGQISIFIKSSKIRDEKAALTVSFTIKLASRSIKVTQGQKLPIKGQKGQFLIIESRVGKKSGDRSKRSRSLPSRFKSESLEGSWSTFYPEQSERTKKS